MLNMTDYANNLLHTMAEAQTGGTIGRCDICGNEITSQPELDTGVCRECCNCPDPDETRDRLKEDKMIEQADEMRKETGNEQI